jgi:hypothetical protein
MFAAMRSYGCMAVTWPMAIRYKRLFKPVQSI